MHNVKHRWRHEQLEPPVQRDDDIEEEVELVIPGNSNVETQLVEEKSLNWDANPQTTQSWSEWIYSLFWKSLGY